MDLEVDRVVFDLNDNIVFKFVIEIVKVVDGCVGVVSFLV